PTRPLELKEDVETPQVQRQSAPMISMISMSARDYSQHGEQKIITRFFSEYHRQYTPYCVDAGAYDGIVGSNSRALFEAGWSGMVIEPNPRVFKRLVSLYDNRPDVICVQMALSNETKEGVE